MPTRQPTDSGGRGRVYREIKAKLISSAFEPGQRIPLGPLAKGLGVSTTPVRDALTLLAARGLAIREPGKGFIAIRLSADRFAGLYHLNEITLTTALVTRDPAANPPAAAAVVTSIRDQLEREENRSPEAIAACTGELFSCIAAHPNAHIAQTLGRINDRLFYVRTLEYRKSSDIAVELIGICELFLAERFGELKEAITKYHARRLAQLPEVMELLRR